MLVPTPSVDHAWTPPVCQAFICDGSKVRIAAMHPDFNFGTSLLSLMGRAGQVSAK